MKPIYSFVATDRDSTDPRIDFFGNGYESSCGRGFAAARQESERFTTFEEAEAWFKGRAIITSGWKKIARS
jgi:hypothetical protein